MYALSNCTLYTGTEVVPQGTLVIRDRQIAAVLPQSLLNADYPVIDLQGLNVSPGFIDLQLNGCGGVMFNDAIAASTLDIMHQTNLRSGTTSFLPTLITTSDDDMHTAMAVVQRYRRVQPYRALGLHLEGPYLHPKRRGIHNADYVRSPDAAMIEAIAQAGAEIVRLITLAPECVSESAIQRLKQAGVTVAAGHTDADYDQANSGFEAGVSLVTHLFNAMSPWQSRAPGMVGAALNRADVYAGIIVDGHHVHFTSVALAKRLKGDRLFLVTDATPPAGAAIESFIIGGQRVYCRDGKCVSATGTLGGSALTMIEAIANCVHHVGIPLAEALRMASEYPARAIGLEAQLGRLAPGYTANLTLFDANLNIVGVADQGQLCAFDDRLTVMEQSPSATA